VPGLGGLWLVGLLAAAAVATVTGPALGVVPRGPAALVSQRAAGLSSAMAAGQEKRE
jgi:hypothetical protein